MIPRLGTGVLAAMATAAIAAAARAPAAQSRPTFAADVAPIVYARCVSCHRPGQPAPFSLLSYTDVQARAAEIADAVAARRMPPWQAAQGPGFPAVSGDRRLTDRQITTIRAWAANGAPPGDLRRVPALPSFRSGWPLGLPDLIVAFPRSLSLPADDADRMLNVVIPLDLPDDRLIRAFDYQPSEPGLISHALLFAVPATTVVGDDDPIPGVPSLLGPGPIARMDQALALADRTVELLGVWTERLRPGPAPQGTALRLPKRTNLVLQLHARASDTGTIEDGRVGLYFGTPRDMPLVSIQTPPSFGAAAGLEIPAGEARVVMVDRFTLPVDVVAWGARGHANDAGRHLRLTATPPRGATRGLLRIDRWTVDWQETYWFQAPVLLPKGTVLDAEIIWDNSAERPRRRAGPPRAIVWGPLRSEEIGSLSLVIAAPSGPDALALEAARAAHFQAQWSRRRLPHYDPW